MVAILDIIYDGSNAKSYEAVEVTYDNLNKKQIFNSGNFVADWYNAKKFYIQYLQETHPYLSSVSSCDHFFFDGAEVLYDTAYLKMDGDVATLSYTDKSGWEFYVENGTTPTWNELRDFSQKYWPKDL